MADSCMVQNCKRPRAKRGLCLICYSTAKKLVEGGDVTWDKLVELGLCESDKDPFTSAYDRATKME